MDQPRHNIPIGPEDALTPLYRKIDRLNETMNVINGIAADANRAIKQGRFEELAGHQSRVHDIARNFPGSSG